MAVLLLAFSIAMSRAPEYRVQLQQWISEKAEVSVEFNKLTARLRFYGPELAFDDVTVRSPDRTRVLATARGGSVAFDIWNSIRSGRLTSGRFTLDSPQLGLIRTRDGKIQIAGQSALDEEAKPFAIENLPIGKFRVRDAVVSFQDEATGRGPWSLSGVSFTLSRTADLLEVNGDASLPTALGQSLKFSGRVAGALESPQQVASVLTVEGDSLDLTGWADVLPDRWPAPESGRGSINITAAFVGPQLQSVIAKTQFNDLTAAPPAWSIPLPKAAPLQRPSNPEQASTQPKETREVEAVDPQLELASDPNSTVDEAEMLSYERVHVEARIEREKQGWRARVSSLDLDAEDVNGTAGAEWRSQGIELNWSISTQGTFEIAGKADIVLLQSVAPLLAYLPESEALARLRALHLRGTVRDLDFTARRDAADAPIRYTASASVDAIAFDPVARVPGATGISGAFQVSESKGEFKLDSGPMHVSLPWMFRWPIETHAVRSALTWVDDGQAWHLSTDNLQFDAPDGKGEAKLSVRVPRDGSSPHLDISAQARDLNAASTPKYLPANTLGEQALAWLDNAFVSGRVPRGSLELHGPVRSFPFRDGKGQFLAKGFVEDLTFNYQQGWTPATQLTGNVEFRNIGMHASGMTARVGGLQVTQASGGFADFKQGDLKLIASATGDLSAALDYLQKSPVGEVLGAQFMGLRGEGNTQSEVSLLLPIAHVEKRRLSVTTKLSDATVRLDEVHAPVTALNGSLIVRQSLPVEADLNGTWLGGPLNVVITPDDRTDANATLVASGRASADKIASFVPASVKLNGAMDWRLSTHLSSRDDRGRQVFMIDSSMQGMAVDMPYPVGKAAEEQRALHVELEPRNKQLLARAAFGPLRALVRVQESRGEWKFDRGGVRADAVAAALPDHSGLRIEGSIDRLRLDDWFALGESGSDKPTPAQTRPNKPTKVADFLTAANLRVGVLQLYGYEWPEVRGVMQSTGQGWRVDVTGANAEGQLVIPEDFTGPQPLTIDLDRLIVTNTPKDGGDQAAKSSQRDPRAWPSLRVHIGDMHIENHPIGGLDLLTRRVPEGMRIDALTIAQDAVQAEASGDWLIGPSGERSSLIAKITSSDVRATLKALNYTEFMEAEKAEVSAQLAWPGGFDSSLAKRASGTITVSAEAGQLLTLQPGAGRVLGLFSVAALPRRLSLDFSDLTEKGLSFDTIHGDFEMRDGNAFTSNLLLRGPAAEIGVAGRTGLASQDFDQTAVVTGNLGASIPVAGALAGGPALGAALLLFSQVFKEPLKGIARGYYRIKGTWDEPVVERVDAAEAKESGVVRPKVDG
ncbi:MAG TPA: YhdP family protein [Steroidobacteraceae bacterium]|nr:YhdP family protein [Steroidobacteraceae bacterium]